MGRQRSSVHLDGASVGRAFLLVAEGTLDSLTYSEVRNAVVKAALDEPDAVIVDVTALEVPSPSAWSVFTSARWHVSTWPDVPVLLVCEQPGVRAVIRSGGIARYVPVHPTRQSALEAAGNSSCDGRHRARAELAADGCATALARTLVAEWLTAWGQPSLVPAVNTLATILIENAISYTHSAPVLLLEQQGDTVTVAVQDASHQPANRHEDAEHGANAVSGLAIVAALAKAWGSIPTASGKTVWAAVGPENRI